MIVVDGGDLLPTPRTWWTLRWAGIESVRVLDGGMARWDGPTEVTATTTVTGTVVVRRGDLEALDANEALVRARAGALVDVRAPERAPASISTCTSDRGANGSPIHSDRSPQTSPGRVALPNAGASA